MHAQLSLARRRPHCREACVPLGATRAPRQREASVPDKRHAGLIEYSSKCMVLSNYTPLKSRINKGMRVSGA